MPEPQAITGAVLDMDGVLWQGTTVLAGAQEIFAALRAKNIPFVLATNNATNTVSRYVRKLADIGVDVRSEQIITSSVATAGYLSRNYPAGTKIYVVGERGLHETLSAAGFRILTPEEVRGGARASAVVGGLTTQNLSYELLAMATLQVREGAAYIASNYDLTFPTELGFLPGAGSVLSVISQASGKMPTIIGKPYPSMFAEACARLGTEAASTLMIGDRIDTDIDGAHNAGLQTALLLTGVSKREDIADIEPTYIFDGLPELIDALATGALPTLTPPAPAA